jgi:hypothetical protein
MVTFTRIPYAQAARRARIQDRIVYVGIILTALIAVLLAPRFVYFRTGRSSLPI